MKKVAFALVGILSALGVFAYLKREELAQAWQEALQEASVKTFQAE